MDRHEEGKKKRGGGPRECQPVSAQGSFASLLSALCEGLPFSLGFAPLPVEPRWELAGALTAAAKSVLGAGAGRAGGGVLLPRDGKFSSFSSGASCMTPSCPE